MKGLNNPDVKCYSGYIYAEEPRSFTLEGVEYTVEEIAGTWREPGEEHFLVRAGGSKIFKLCYNESKERWSVTEVVRR